MDEEKVDAKYSPLVKGYQDKIEMLSSLIDKLEDAKRVLDTKLASHQANSLNIEASESQLRELLKEIDFRRQVGIDTSTETNDLIAKKLKLQEEVEQLEVLVQKKKDYITDIEKYPEQTKILQEEMERFQNEHAENKRQALRELTDIKDKVKEIHSHIGVILNK